mgnify:CR=1 FL=1
MKTLYIDKNRENQEIVSRLNNGEDKEVIAQEYGFKSSRSMDSRLRRNGYHCPNGFYEKIPTEPIENFNCASAKAEKIAMSLNEYVDAGISIPVDFHKKYGFASKQEMQKYLKENGAIYNPNTKKYEPDKDADAKWVAKQELIQKEQAALRQQMECHPENGTEDSFDAYMPFIQLLYQNREVLITLLTVDVPSETPPRINVGGEKITKSIYIAKSISRLIDDFHYKTGLSIREIIEVAIVEYLKKYGYEKEIKKLLERE